MKEKLAIHGGSPVRGRDNPFPGVFPRVISEDALENVKKVLDSGFTLNMASDFEKAFAEASGAKYAISTTSCTTAVHAAMGVCGLNPGDEVLVSPISDFGSVAGVLWQNAIPVFPDIDIRTGNITAEEVEKKVTQRTKAIVVVHFYGLLCDMDPIMDVAKKHNLIVIEDACQAPLAEYRGQMAGAIGDMGCFSFDAEKHLAADHGGMVITSNEQLAAAVRNFAIARAAEHKPGYGRLHTMLGTYYRYGSVLSAIGLAQLKILPEQNARRTKTGKLLNELLADVDGVHTPYIVPGSVPVYWLYFVRFELDKFNATLDELSAALNAEGMPGGPGRYYLIPQSHTFLVDKAHAYGTSKCPFDCKYTDCKEEYGEECVPNAAAHVNSVFRWQWTDKYTEEDVADMATAIRKVADYYRR